MAVLPNNDVCPCCQFTLAFGADSTAYLGLRKIFADGRDSAVARSSDGGKSFSIAGRLDFAKWDINGCPLKPTELAIADNNVYAAAYTGGEDPAGLYFTLSRDGGKTFRGSRAVHPAADIADAPALSVDSSGTIRLVWHAKVGAPHRLYTSVSTNNGATLSEPVQLNTPAGKSMRPATGVAANGTVYVTWEQENEEVFILALPAPGTQAQARR